MEGKETIDFKNIVELKFEKETKGNSAHFKGILLLLVDEYDLIYNVNVEITKCCLDLYTTSSKYKSEFGITRRKLFKKLGLPKQIERLSDTKPIPHKFEELKPHQVEILNEEINKNIKSKTIKSIITLIKGSNPAGEGAIPSVAELKTKYKNNLKPFTLLVENLRVKNEESNKPENNVLLKKNQVDPIIPQISFEEWIEGNIFLRDIYKSLCIEKKSYEYITTVKVIRKKVKDYAKSSLNLRKKVSYFRGEYKKNLLKTYSDVEIKRLFNWNSPKEYYKAHIKPVKQIKEETSEILKNFKLDEDKKWNLINTKLQEISDPENFLPLDGITHKRHDDLWVIYNVEGELIRISDDYEKKDFDILKSNNKNYNLDKLPNEFLTEKRLYYIKENLKMIENKKQIDLTKHKQRC